MNQQEQKEMQSAVENIMERYPDAKRENLIPILQEIQEREGYLSEGAILEVGQRLKLPASKIFGVATFYNQFRFEPLGKFHIQVCRGTACHVLGSSSVLEELEKHLNVKAGQTTKDGLFSIEVVACIGACGLAPVISVNGEFYAKVTAGSISEIVDEYRQKAGEGVEHE
ncbi:MAG: NADH-quinone oxidoreductase subunit NuoE [Bacteroidota bacterium]|nr:NADH-quinone oxidoreductase subunit NuoE [Bacteroidota bacterium]